MANKERTDLTEIYQDYYPGQPLSSAWKIQVARIPEFVSPEEIVFAFVFGRDLNGVSWGSLVATDRRLLWFCKGLLGTSTHDMTYDQVTSLDVSTSLGDTIISIQTSAGLLGTKAVKNVSASAATKFVSQVRSHMAQLRIRRETSQSSQAQPHRSLSEQLESLAHRAREEF